MTAATMYDEEMFVLLIPGSEQVFLEPAELLAKLKQMLADYSGSLPRDLQKFSTLEEQALHLRDTSCSFEVQPGITWQWYAVRLEK